MAAFTDNARVRREAGFSGNTNIEEDTVTAALDAAHAVVVGVVSQHYTLPLSYTPESLKLIEARLAAGYLLQDEYGEQAEGTSKEGDKKVKWAMDQLQLVEAGTVQLLDANGVVLARNATAGMEGYPLHSDADYEEGERAFTRDMEF